VHHSGLQIANRLRRSLQIAADFSSGNCAGIVSEKLPARSDLYSVTINPSVFAF
jgi:hypothetical protein